MVFDCAMAGPSVSPGHDTVLPHDLTGAMSTPGSSSRGNVYLLHGDDGARSKAMWTETMLQLSARGYNTLACDQRGFSPGASPNRPEAYNYDTLASDIMSITGAAGFGDSFGGRFHAVAHDQGARVVWHSIALGLTRDRLLSFSSLSIPHADVFSSNVCCGDGVEQVDQTAQQYVRQLTLNSSVTVNHNAIFRQFCFTLGFNTTEWCQKTFWWYNGAIDAGAMAVAPLMPFERSIASKIDIPFDMVRQMTPYPLDGVPQTVKVGVVRDFPVFFACGSEDTCDLCEPRVVSQTASMVASAFTSVINECGHALIDPAKCPDQEERQKVINGIVANIEAGNA